jgi:hypothetical protein
MAIELFDILTYDYNITENIDITSDYDSFDTVNTLITPNRLAGVYEVKLGIVWNLDTTNKSGIARFSLDGGNTWQEVWSEPKDKTNDNVGDFTRTLVHQGGQMHIIIEMAKEGGTASMVCEFSEISVRRVG